MKTKSILFILLALVMSVAVTSTASAKRETNKKSFYRYTVCGNWSMWYQPEDENPVEVRTRYCTEYDLDFSTIPPTSTIVNQGAEHQERPIPQ